MSATYEYDPSKLSEHGKDLMRFQLGDTMVEGKEATCAPVSEIMESGKVGLPRVDLPSLRV